MVAKELRKYGLRYEDLYDPQYDLVSLLCVFSPWLIAVPVLPFQAWCQQASVQPNLACYTDRRSCVAVAHPMQLWNEHCLAAALRRPAAPFGC